MVLITIVTGAYKPIYNWGASHCIIFDFDSHLSLPGVPPGFQWRFEWENHLQVIFAKFDHRRVPPQ